MPRVPVEPISVDDAHVFACFDALLAHLNGHSPPAVSFADAIWCEDLRPAGGLPVPGP